VTREFKSWRSFWDFEYAVRRKFRYVRLPEHEDFLKTVIETSHSRKVVMKEGFVLWRAQLGHDYRDEHQDGAVFEVPCAYPRTRMKPLPDKAYDGRANPKGIPCLYLATEKETALSEVRPWIGSYVSVGQFQILRNIDLIDCYFEEPAHPEREKAVWAHIDRAFAKRINLRR
jgi:RES domain